MNKSIGDPESALTGYSAFGRVPFGDPSAPDMARGGDAAGWAMSVLTAAPAFFKALAAGERWITVRAPGHDKGQPILVKPAGDGAYKVIGGAPTR